MSKKREQYIRISGDDNFHDRSNTIFGCLDSLEPAKQDESKETSPRIPPRVPDHVLHPAKWTKYSLTDDGSESYRGLSGEVANRNIALSFLDELQKRKASGSKSEVTSDDPTDSSQKEEKKLHFSKDSRKRKMEVDDSKKEDTSVESQSQVKDGVNVMPEYVVGQTPKKSSRMCVSIKSSDKCATSEGGHEVGLEHLQEQEQHSEADVRQEEAPLSKAGEEQASFVKKKTRSRKGIRKRGAEESDDCSAQK